MQEIVELECYDNLIPKKWDLNSYKKFISNLLLFRDEKYLAFNKKITFTKYKMIGIRVPILRKIAKMLAKSDFRKYLDVAGHEYFEEILLEGIVLSYIKEYDEFLERFNLFLPFIDNWAVCDMTISSLKIIRKNKELFEKEIIRLLRSKYEYDVRVGIVILMDYYLTGDKLGDVFNYLDSIKRNEYYIEMAMAWLISVCYIKYPIETEKYFSCNLLSDSVINKAIQKIRDSKRVKLSDKDKLLQYKRK